MARFNFFAVLLILYLAVFEIDGKRKRKNPEEKKDFTGVYKCIMGHFHCDKSALYKDTWYKLLDVTQHWLIDRINECGLYNFKYGMDFDFIVEKLKTFDETKWWPCFDKTCDLLCEYSKETTKAGESDEKKKNESDKMEEVRKDVTMNLGLCSYDNCVMSRDTPF